MHFRTAITLGLLISASTAFCQSSDQDSAAAPKPLHWTAQADGYTASLPGSLDTNTIQFSGSDVHANTPRLNSAWVGLDYSLGQFGAHMDTGYGDAFHLMMLPDRLHGANDYIPQLFVSYRPLKGSGLQLDFGKFYTSVGAEVPDPNGDFNYSRSLLFTLGEPLYHFGLRASIPVTKKLTAGVQLTNGWNNVEDNNRGKTLGFTTAFTESSWGWSQAFLIGPEDAGLNSGTRQLANEVLTLTPRPSMQAYVELLYGHDQRSGLGANAWYGTAVAYRWNATKKLSFSPRVEYFVDQTGFNSGLPQHVKEATATAEYKCLSFLSTRLEYREDVSNQPFFPASGSSTRKTQGTLTFALLASIKGER